MSLPGGEIALCWKQHVWADELVLDVHNYSNFPVSEGRLQESWRGTFYEGV